MTGNGADRGGVTIPRVHILHTPLKEVAAFSEGERYCFRCRTRQPFMRVVLVTREMSYYGPTREVRCCVCDELNGDCFPGTWREWKDDR